MKYAFAVLICLFMVGPVFGVTASSAFLVNASTNTTAPRLPYGVADILKLSRAEVSDEIIVKYIKNTGTIYNLAPETIVYLKDEGVSDTVLDAMLDQPKSQSGATSTWASQAPAQMPPQQQPAPTYTQPPQADPVPQPPKSTLHIIPYYPATYDFHYRSGWPGAYYRPYWYGPRISLGVGFGFGHYYHHRHHFGFRCW